MAVLNTAGSTITAGTYEQAIDELATRIADAQLSSTSNPQQVAGVTIDRNSANSQSTFLFEIPLTVNVAGSARSFVAQNYLEGISYSSGTGALTGGNMIQDLVNLLFDIENFEGNAARNPANESRLTIAIESDPWKLAASLTLQHQLSIVAGAATYRSMAYLV